jgi:tetratricopeptide (TPR) repeat protein
MEWRKGLWLALGLGGAVGGCQHQEMTLSPGAVPPGAVVQKAPQGPKKMPTTDTLVKFGDFRLKEATGPQYEPAQREALLEEARKSYQEALKRDAKCVAAYQGLGRLYVLTDQYGKAVEQYQKALKKAPKDGSIWFDLGMCYKHMQEWDKALDAIRKAADLDPENRDYANALAVLLARAGRYQESLDCFSRVSGPAMAQYKLGCTLRYLNQPELSRKCLEAALQENPQLGQAQAVLSELDGDQGIRPVGYTEPQPAPADNPETPFPSGGETPPLRPQPAGENPPPRQ